MTLEELETLLKRAEDVLGKRVQMTKAYGGKWNVYIEGGPLANDLVGATPDQCITKLKQWATPPKPKTLTFTLQTDYCERVMNDFETDGRFVFERNGGLFNALVEALAPYQQPE